MGGKTTVVGRRRGEVRTTWNSGVGACQVKPGACALHPASDQYPPILEAHLLAKRIQTEPSTHQLVKPERLDVHCMPFGSPSARGWYVCKCGTAPNWLLFGPAAFICPSSYWHSKGSSAGLQSSCQFLEEQADSPLPAWSLPYHRLSQHLFSSQVRSGRFRRCCHDRGGGWHLHMLV